MKKYLFYSYKVFQLFLLLFSFALTAQIAAWDFNGQSISTTFAATTFDVHLISTPGANMITRGTGAAASAAVNSFRTQGFKNDGISTANTDYFQVTLTSEAGYELSLSTLDARFDGTSTFFASPGVTSQFAYSLDGTNFTLIGSPQIFSAAPSILAQINLTSISDLQNIGAGTTVTLRYYASGQTTTGGWGFQSGATIGNNGLAIGGSIVPSGKRSNCAVCAWDNPTTWLPVGVPVSTDIVTIRPNDIVYNTISGLERTAATNVYGSFQIETGSSVSANLPGAINFNYGTTGSLIFNTDNFYGVNSNDLYWPFFNGPPNVKVLNGGFKLNGGTTRIITGDLETSGGVALAIGENLTINGKVQINPGGYFDTNSAPTYGPVSTLIYNTGSIYYNTNTEWNNGAYNNMVAGKSIPHNVIIQDAKVYLSYPCGLDGDLTITGPTAELQLNTIGGNDLYLKGNFAKPSGNLIFNDRAVFFTKNGIQTVSSATPLTIPYVVLSPASGTTTVRLTAGTNLNITAPAGGNAVIFTNAAHVFDINNQSLSIGTEGQSNNISGNGSFKGSVTSNLTLLGNGSIGTLNITGGLNNFIINRQPNIIAAVLGTDLIVNGELKLSNGIIDLNNNQLTSAATGTITNASISNYIIADRTKGGSLRRNITSLGSYTFPIGDATASADGSQYAPASVNISSGNASGYLVINVEDSKEPNNEASTDFISRYWNLNGDGITSATYDFTGTYTPIDINGFETNSISGRYANGSWTIGSPSATNTLTIGGLTTASGAISTSTDSNHFSAGSPLQAGTITLDKSSLSGFSYPFGQGPSATQNFLVNGSKLVNNINVTATSNWEISTNQTYDGANVSPWNNIVLIKSAAGAVTNKRIQVRLKDGLPIGTYAGTITLTSTFAATKTINLSGEVTAGLRDIKVTGNGTSITNGSLTPLGLNNTLFASQNLGNAQTKTFEIKNLGGSSLTIGAITISGIDPASFSILNGPAVNSILFQNQTATFEVRFSPTSIGTKSATVRIESDDPNDNPYFFSIKGGSTYCSSAGEVIIARQDFEISPAVPVMNYVTANFGTIVPGPNTGFSSGKSLSTDMPKTNNLYSEGARGYRIQGADPDSQIPSRVSLTFDQADTSAYTDISLSFKVAGFSLGSASNGMDDWNAANTSTVLNADKIDYVMVEISPDGGANWYAQAKVVSGEVDLPWSFGSDKTVDGSRIYAADNNLTYFNSTSAARYSAISISGLPSVVNLKIRITAQDNALNESWILDDVRITSTGLVPKIWNGSSWLPSVPQSSDKAILNADYNSGIFGGFKVCQCEVSSAAALTISPNTEVKISDVLINNGVIVVQSQGSLIQVNETDSNSGTGTFSAEQNINLSTGRNQYNYIISPAEGFNLKDLYTKSLDINNMPVTVPFALYHNETTNTYLNSSGTYIKGRALAIKEPTASFAPGQITAVFEGKPVNGQFNYTLNNSNFANSNRGYNLIGNPFPSHMDLVQFYQNNSASNNLSPTFYIWDNNANLQTIQLGDAYLGQAYARFNAATPAGVGTPIKASVDAGATTLKIPTRYVSTGQGFMAKLDNIASESIKFSNSIRSSLASQGFFGKNNVQTKLSIDRYWLNLINPSNVASNIAVVYSEGGLDAFTKEDSPSLGTSDEIYSIVGDEKVSINGKSNFVDTDVVAIGTKHFAAGTYKIALDKAEGIFSNSQHIYLKDLQTGILTDLSQGLYSFEGIAGETVDRFQIIYEPQIILATDGKANGEVMVYRDGMDFIIKSNIKKISNVTCYDPSGRLILEIFPNQKEVHLDAAVFSKGIYFLKINRHGEITTKKIIL